MTKSASELTYFVCQMLTTPSKNEFQAILNENDIEKRMQIVGAFMNKELIAKRAQKDKIDALNKRIKDRFAGQGGGTDEESKDEVQELEEKLKSLDMPEEAQKIAEQEIRKLKNLGPKNQEYHVSMNYLQTMADLPWNIQDEENLDPAKAKD